MRGETALGDDMAIWRAWLTRTMVWICVLAWGPLLGAKIFDLLVLAGAWSADPPRSLRLLPYGPNYPIDTGDFFIPSSAALLCASIGSLVAGWRTPLAYRGLLAASTLAIFSILVMTVIFFWPMNSDLWRYAIAPAESPLDAAGISAMARRWVMLDWLRVGIATAGFVAAARALSIPYPSERTDTDPGYVKALLSIGLILMAAFVVYFASNI